MLTDKGREVLDAAEAIFKSLFNEGGEVIRLSYHAGWEAFSLSYFTPNKYQNMSVLGYGSEYTLADRAAESLRLKAEEAARSEEHKAIRIAELKAKLAELEGEGS